MESSWGRGQSTALFQIELGHFLERAGNHGTSFREFEALAQHAREVQNLGHNEARLVVAGQVIAEVILQRALR